MGLLQHYTQLQAFIPDFTTESDAVFALNNMMALLDPASLHLLSEYLSAPASRNGCSPQHFIILNKELQRLEEKKHLITKDIHSYAELRICDAVGGAM